MSASDLERERRSVERLKLARDSRVVIEQDRGIIAQCDGISVDHAFLRHRAAPVVRSHPSTPRAGAGQSAAWRLTGLSGQWRLPVGDGTRSTRGPIDTGIPPGMTFDIQVRAQGWLANELGLIERGEWIPPALGPRASGAGIDLL